MTSQLCRVQVTYSDRKNKHRITLERRYHVNITVLSSKELATFLDPAWKQEKRARADCTTSAYTMRTRGQIFFVCPDRG